MKQGFHDNFKELVISFKQQIIKFWPELQSSDKLEAFDTTVKEIASEKAKSIVSHSAEFFPETPDPKRRFWEDLQLLNTKLTLKEQNIPDEQVNIILDGISKKNQIDKNKLNEGATETEPPMTTPITASTFLFPTNKKTIYPDFSTLQNSTDDSSTDSSSVSGNGNNGSGFFRTYFKRSLSYTLSKKVKKLPQFKLYEPEAIVNFLVELTPIANRNRHKFKQILAILAEREMDTMTANFLYNALSYTKINFEILGESLLKNGMSEKQYLQIKSKRLFSPQDEITPLRYYIDEQITLLRIFGELNELKNIKNLISAIHPKYLVLLGNAENITSYNHLFDKIKEAEIIINERYGNPSVPNFNKPSYADIVHNHKKFENRYRDFHQNKTKNYYHSSPNRNYNDNKKYNFNNNNSTYKQNLYNNRSNFNNRDNRSNNQNFNKYKHGNYKDLDRYHSKESYPNRYYGNPTRQKPNLKNQEYHKNKNKPFSASDDNVFATLNRNIKQILELRQLLVQTCSLPSSSNDTTKQTKISKN